MEVLYDVYVLNTIIHNIQQVSNHNHCEHLICIMTLHACNRLLTGRIQADVNVIHFSVVQTVGSWCALQTNMYKYLAITTNAMSSTVLFGMNI